MCMRWVGLAHFPLGQIQGLIARGQGSAAGSEKCLSAKFIWGPFILSSGVFVSILLLLPYCHTCIGHARVTGWGRTSAVYSLQAWIRGGVEWWCRGGFRSKQCLMEQRKGSHSPRITAATVKRTKAFRVKNPFTSLLVMFSTLFLANRDRVWIADRIWWRPLWFLCAFSPLLWTIAASGIQICYKLETFKPAPLRWCWMKAVAPLPLCHNSPLDRRREEHSVRVSIGYLGRKTSVEVSQMIKICNFTSCKLCIVAWLGTASQKL